MTVRNNGGLGAVGVGGAGAVGWLSTRCADDSEEQLSQFLDDLILETPTSRVHGIRSESESAARSACAGAGSTKPSRENQDANEKDGEGRASEKRTCHCSAWPGRSPLSWYRDEAS